MANLNFPDSPAPNEIYTVDGISWKWAAGSWKNLGALPPDLINLYNLWERGNATNTASPAIVSSAVTLDCSDSNVHKVVLTGSITLNEPINPESGQVMNIIFEQDGSGNRTVTFDTVFKFPGGTVPTLSVLGGAKDILTCQYDADYGFWYCILSKNFY